jgi:transcriptional regulator GlxA family with amidase domain
MLKKIAVVIGALALIAGTVAIDAPLRASSLTAPANGKMIVAFVITQNTNVMDVAGPWEVFQDVHVPERGKTMDAQMPFTLIVVSDTTNPIRMTGGLTVTPDYTFDNAPDASIIVVPAQSGAKGLSEWLRARHAKGQVVMSVCTGAFKLADAGLLKGKHATTHHDFHEAFAEKFPDVTLEPGDRFVQADATTFTAGGLTSGIDLALHLVALYFGPDAAARTAKFMEHSGTGWMNPEGASPVAHAQGG